MRSMSERHLNYDSSLHLLQSKLSAMHDSSDVDINHVPLPVLVTTQVDSSIVDQSLHASSVREECLCSGPD